MGELSREGAVRHVRGVLPMAALTRAGGYQAVLVPADHANGAALIPGVSVIPARFMLQHDRAEDSQRG